MMRHLFSVLFALLLPLCLMAQFPVGYYDAVNGLVGAELKAGLQGVIGKATVLPYGGGVGKTWSGFYLVDRYDGNRVRDRYSYSDFRFPADATEQTAVSVNGMNIEHSFAKSWWGGAENQAYKDLFNLMPCESNINSSKSNFVIGKVTTVKTTNGCTKVGQTVVDGLKFSVWEPADEWKGDFARTYFYMVTAYGHLTWGGEGLNMLDNNLWPTLKPWASRLLLDWCRQDPVDNIEVARNNAVFAIQGNRNPFVDFPNLAEYIWGDSLSIAFRVSDNPVGSDVTPIQIALHHTDFTQGDGGWTVSNTVLPSYLSQVWKQTAEYGMKASAYVSGKSGVAESWLISPQIDLSEMADAEFTFSHTGKFFGTMTDEATLWVSTDDGANWQPLVINRYMTGDDWVFVGNTTNLAPYCGLKVRVAFCYKSTKKAAGTWEIKTCKVTGVKKATGSTVTGYLPTADGAPSLSYDLSGRIASNAHRGIYIVNGRKQVR